MANSLLQQSPSVTPSSEKVRGWIARLVFGLAIATLFLMALGSATRVMNAGLSCPDWPLCYGKFVPSDEMNLQVFLEWFHRLVATTIGFGAIALCASAWWFRRSLPNWTPWAASFALFLVVFQGVLGGLTVTELLRFDIVTAHLGTGLLFFGTLVTIGSALIAYSGLEARLDSNFRSLNRLKWVGTSAAALVYLQSILGGLVSSQWALHQCLGMSKLCAVMNTHIAGIVPPTLTVLALVILAWRSVQIPLVLRNLSTAAGLLVLLQITLGVATFKLRLQVEPLTVAHQAIGATLLGTLTVFSVFAWRSAASSKLASA